MCSSIYQVVGNFRLGPLALLLCLLSLLLWFSAISVDGFDGARFHLRARYLPPTCKHVSMSMYLWYMVCRRGQVLHTYRGCCLSLQSGNT